MSEWQLIFVSGAELASEVKIAKRNPEMLKA